MAGLDRATLIAELLREYAQELEIRVPDGPLTLEQIETLVEELGREQDTRLEEALIRRQLPPGENQTACPQCDGMVRFKRVAPLEVGTIHGTRRLLRRYYRCTDCEYGLAPLDLHLQLEGLTQTRQLRAWQAKYGSLAAFDSVPELLRDLRGMEVSASTVERTTLEVGAALAEAERLARAAERAAPGARPEAPSAPPAGERLYLGMDGVFCPLRDAWRKDGSLGKLACRYGECKVGVVYRTQQQDGVDTGVRWRAYTATLEKIAGFTPRMVDLARSHGSEQAGELVVLGDGADWIWNLCAQHFPQALQIVDYWHMTQHLYTVAHARFGKGTPAADEWVKHGQWFLDRDLPESALAQIAEWQPQSAEEQKLRATEIGYFTENQERMRYGTFLKRGYHIGSGVVEATCRQLVTQRLKQVGMHWREKSAEAVVTLRARLKSSDSTDLRMYC